MRYVNHYQSPIGEIVLASDGEALTGLWFTGQKRCGACAGGECEERELPVFDRAKKWLDIYFSGKEPQFKVPVRLEGPEFQREVWRLLAEIPYGETTTYSVLAAAVAKRRGLARMSAQAVGGAIGRNPVAIVVPCHRVIGAEGGLVGYAGGLERKRTLLELEGSFNGVATTRRQGYRGACHQERK